MLNILKRTQIVYADTKAFFSDVALKYGLSILVVCFKLVVVCSILVEWNNQCQRSSHDYCTENIYILC